MGLSKEKAVFFVKMKQRIIRLLTCCGRTALISNRLV